MSDGKGIKLFEMFGDFVLRDGNAINKINQIDNKAAVASKSMGSMFKIIGQIGAWIGLSVGIAKSIQEFEKLESTMANVSTLLDGTEEVVKEKTKSFTEEIQKMRYQVGLSADILGEGLYQTISAFGDTADSMVIMEIASKSAVAGNASVIESINLLSAVTKGYGDTSAEANQKAADLAFQTVKLGQTTYQELAGSMGRAIPLAVALRVSQEDLFGAYATLTGVTGNTAEVSTQLRGVFQGLIQPTDAMRNSIAQLGYENGRAMLESLGLQGTLEALKQTVGGNELQFTTLFGSVEALNAVLALTGSQSDTLADKTKKMSDVTGLANEAFKRQSDTLEGAKKRFSEFGKAIMADLGTGIGNGLKAVINFILKYADQIRGGIKSLITFISNLFTTGMKLIKEVFGEAWSWMGKQIQKYGPVIITLAQSVWNAFTSGSGIIKKAIDFIKNTVSAWVANNQDKVEMIKNGWNSLCRFVVTIINWMVTNGTNFWNKYGKNIVSIITKTFNWLMTTFAHVFNVIGKILDIFSDIFSGNWGALWGDIKELFSSIWNAITNILGGYLGLIWDTTKFYLGVVGDAFAKAFSSIARIVMNAGSDIKIFFLGAIKSLLEGIQGFVSFIPGISGLVQGAIKGIDGAISRTKITKALRDYEFSANQSEKATFDLASRIAELTEKNKKSADQTDQNKKKTTEMKFSLDDLLLSADSAGLGADNLAAGLDKLGGTGLKAKDGLDQAKEALSALGNEIQGKVDDINAVGDMLMEALKEYHEQEYELFESSMNSYIEGIKQDIDGRIWANGVIYEETQKRYDDELEAAERAKDRKKQVLDADYDQIKWNINRQMKAEKEASDRLVDIIRNQYDERRAVKSQYTNEMVDGLQAEIDAIDEQVRQEEKAEALQKRQDRIKELEEEIEASKKLVKEKKELIYFETDERELERVNEEISREEESIKENEERIQETKNEIEKERIREEREAEKERIREKIEGLKADEEKFIEETKKEEEMKIKVVEDAQKEKERLAEEELKKQESHRDYMKNEADIEYDAEETNLERKKEQSEKAHENYLAMEEQRKQEAEKAIQKEIEDKRKETDAKQTDEALIEEALGYLNPEGQKSMMSLLDTYLPGWKTKGKTFGDTFLEGLASAFDMNNPGAGLNNFLNKSIAYIKNALGLNETETSAPKSSSQTSREDERTKLVQNINIQSNEPLDPGEVARQLKKVTEDLAFQAAGA